MKVSQSSLERWFFELKKVLTVLSLFQKYCRNHNIESQFYKLSEAILSIFPTSMHTGVFKIVKLSSRPWKPKFMN